MAAAGAQIYLLLLTLHLLPGGSDGADQERTFSESKRCADPECSKLMCRGKAVADFTGPDCRFANFKKGELLYVYHKLSGKSSELWAGTVGTHFGYFPKDLVEITQVYTTNELELPTDDTDFVCFEDGADTFDTYDVKELLSKAKTTSQPPPSTSESLPAEPSASESEEIPFSQSSEPPGDSSKSGSEEPTKEIPPLEAKDVQEEPSLLVTKEPQEKPSPLDSKPLEELSILNAQLEPGDQPASEFSIPQDIPPASDSGSTTEEPHLLSETLTPPSQSKVSHVVGVSEPETQPAEESTSNSDIPTEELPASDFGDQQENPYNSDSEIKARQPHIPESGKPSVTPSAGPEEESDNVQENDEHKVRGDTLSAPNDVHATTVNSKSKDSQEESVAHLATEENAKSESQVPDSDDAKNVTSQGRTKELDEKKTIESFTLIDKDRVRNLKTDAGSTGDAVVTEDEETRRVTFEGEYKDFEDQDKDFEFNEQEEREGVEEAAETPLLSYEELDMRSSDQTAFENDSASATASEAKTSPSQEDVQVSVDMGHATPVKQDKSILTSLGDTFFAIVSGGEHTRDVTDLDGDDSEEQEDDDDDETSEELEEDENLYLLGMEKSHMPESQHLEPPFDEDTIVLKEEVVQEPLSVVDGDESLEAEHNINVTANKVSENTVNMSSSGETTVPKSTTKTVQEDPDIQDHPAIISAEEGSESQMKAVDPTISDKSIEGRQIPSNNAPLEGSVVQENSIKISEENKVNVYPIDIQEELQENKNLGEDLSGEGSLKPKVSANEQSPKLSVQSNQGSPNSDENQTEEVKLEKSPSSNSDVPEDVRPATAEHPGEVEASEKPSPDPGVKETPLPETVDNLEDGKPVDGSSLETSKSNKKPEHGQLESSDQEEKQEAVHSDSVERSTESNKKPEHGHLESSDQEEKQEAVHSDSVERSTESTLNNQDRKEKLASNIESPSVSPGKEEKDEEDVDGFLEDENAASARQAGQMLAKTEQAAKAGSMLSEKSELHQKFENSDLQSKETNTQATEESLRMKKDSLTETKEEEIGKENKESVVVAEDITHKNINSDVSGTGIELHEEEAKTKSLEAESKSETRKEDAQEDPSNQTDDKIVHIEESEPSAEELSEESIFATSDGAEEGSYIENIKALSIMREFLDEERVTQFTKYLGPDNTMRLEAMFQDMDSELKSARRDNLRLDYLDKALDQILEASESTILDFVESVLESRESSHEQMVMEKEMFDEEAVLLDDVQEISYRLRHKHSTLGDSSLLLPGEVTEEEEEKLSSDEVKAEGDKLEAEAVTKEEESPVTPPEEEMEQIPETEDGTLEEDGDGEVLSPTQDSPDHIAHQLDQAISQNDRYTEIDAALEGEGGEEPQDSESWYTSIRHIFSGIGSALLAAKKSLSPVASLLMSALPEDMRPGPDFYGMQWEAVVITVLVGLVSVLIFFWRTCLSVKRRVYQVSETQLAEKISALMKEKSEALEKISELEKKVKEAKESESTTQEESTHLQKEAASLKVTNKELKNSNKQLDAKMKKLAQELDSQKSQNKRKQEMIYEGQKSIEQLKQQYEQHSAELSELQIALNEAKMKEQKVRSDFRSVKEENNCLKERKEQLLKEAEGWSERQRELEEQIQLQQKSHKDMEEALAYKENEIDVLTNCIVQLKQLEEDSVSGEDGNWQPGGEGELENGELPDKRKEKLRLQIKQMMDVSRVKTTLSIIVEEKELYQSKLTNEISARHELEEQIENLQHENSSLLSDKTRLDNEHKTLRQKVEILTELYQQKEMALQKKLTQEEYERQEKEQKLSAADEKAILAVEEVKIYKQRIQEMEEELQKTERSFKNQIASHEKKAHENWLVARTAERTLAEEKRECANLRQKLIEVNQRVVALQRPSIVKPTPGRPEHQLPPRRGALSRDGSFGPSPVSGGAPSPPIMMDVSVRSASANLSRSEDLKGNLSGVDAPSSGTRRPPHDMSGRISAPVDLGHSGALLNSGPRTSSPSVDGLVMPVAKGPPSFPGTPVMNSPAGAPMMSQPPGRLIGPTPPRGHFGSRSLPPAPMHGPPPVSRDFPPRPLMPPGGIPPPDPRGLMRGPLPPREYPPGPIPIHGPRDYPMPPPGARDFPPGLPPPGPRDFPPSLLPHAPRDFPPGPPPPGARDFLPGLPPPGARDFPPGLPPPGAQEFPPGMRDFPPGLLPPGARDIPPGLPPPGARDFPPVLPPLGSREFVPGLPPPGARNFLPGPPVGSREFLPGPPPHGVRDFPPGARDFMPGPHPGVPAGPSLPDQRPFPPGHKPPPQTDNEQAHSKP